LKKTNASLREKLVFQKVPGKKKKKVWFQKRGGRLKKGPFCLSEREKGNGGEKGGGGQNQKGRPPLKSGKTDDAVVVFRVFGKAVRGGRKPEPSLKKKKVLLRKGQGRKPEGNQTRKGGTLRKKKGKRCCP